MSTYNVDEIMWFCKVQKILLYGFQVSTIYDNRQQYKQDWKSKFNPWPQDASMIDTSKVYW